MSFNVCLYTLQDTARPSFLDLYRPFALPFFPSPIMLSDDCIAYHVEHVYENLTGQFSIMKKGALVNCCYKTDFIKKTSNNCLTFTSKMPSDKGRPFCANVFGQIVHAGDGTCITTLGNWWAGNPSGASGDYVHLVLPRRILLLICIF